MHTQETTARRRHDRARGRPSEPPVAVIRDVLIGPWSWPQAPPAADCFPRLRSLTSREAAVLAGLASGLTPGQIASVHRRSISTVRTQVAAILAKLEVHSQADAIAVALRAAAVDEVGLRTGLAEVLHRLISTRS